MEKRNYMILLTQRPNKIKYRIFLIIFKNVLVYVNFRMFMIVGFFQSSVISLGEDVDAEAEEVLNELNLLTEHQESIISVKTDSSDWSKITFL